MFLGETLRMVVRTTLLCLPTFAQCLPIQISKYQLMQTEKLLSSLQLVKNEISLLSKMEKDEKLKNSDFKKMLLKRMLGNSETLQEQGAPADEYSRNVEATVNIANMANVANMAARQDLDVVEGPGGRLLIDDTEEVELYNQKADYRVPAFASRFQSTKAASPSKPTLKSPAVKQKSPPKPPQKPINSPKKSPQLKQTAPKSLLTDPTPERSTPFKGPSRKPLTPKALQSKFYQPRNNSI